MIGSVAKANVIATLPRSARRKRASALRNRAIDVITIGLIAIGLTTGFTVTDG